MRLRRGVGKEEGALQDGRLPLRFDPATCAEIAEDLAQNGGVAIEAIVDAVTARAWAGPTELTPEEIATLFPSPPAAEKLAFARECLRKVGVTLPDLPEASAPSAPPPAPSRGPLVFNRDTIARAALRAYVEVSFADMDTGRRLRRTACGKTD